MDFTDGNHSTAPDCWSGFGQMMSVIEACATYEEVQKNTAQYGEAAAVVGSAGIFKTAASALNQLAHMIEHHPDKPETILAAQYLSAMEHAPNLVLPYCAYVLHEILHGEKLVQMEAAAVYAIQAMSCYGNDAAPYALDVVGCLLLKECPGKVKECALDFFIQTSMPDACDGAFSVVVDQSEDPTIRQWNADRKQEDDEEVDQDHLK